MKNEQTNKVTTRLIVSFYELSEEWQDEAKSNLDEYAYEISYLEPEFNLEYWKSLFFECENKFNKLEESYNFNNEQSEKEITEVKKKNDKLLQNNIKFSNDINKLEREKQTVHETNISLHGKVKDLQDKNDSLITEQTTTRMTIAEYEKRNTELKKGNQDCTNCLKVLIN